MLKSHDRDLLHGSLVRKILEFTGLGKSLQTTVISMLGIGVLRVVLIKTFAAGNTAFVHYCTEI
ncbi:MAG: hypothetical protein MJ052_03980 [Sphaerochaetaceae bacterium]|nr:hypothetical protein [Sphaerochaetaceae bacterium]